MRKGLTRLAASAMSVCLLASAAPAAMYAEAANYPGDSAVSAQGCQYTPVRGSTRPWVEIAYDYNAHKMWMVDKSRNIRVIKGNCSTRYFGDMPTYTVTPSPDRDPLGQQPNWDTNAQMLHNVEKVYDFYKKTVGHTNFNFSGSSDKRLYVCSYDLPGDARSDYRINNGGHGPSEPIAWLGFGNAGQYTYNMGVDEGVVGHELTHLVLWQKLGWYPGMNTETDALMEAYCDIMGELSETNTDWKVAGDAFKSNTATNKRYSYRDLTNPGATNDPLHGNIAFYDDYITFRTNREWLEKETPYSVLPCYSGCTIIGHAAYLMNRFGISKTDLAKIWYKSMNNYSGDAREATFMDCREAVVKAAKSYFGSSSNNVKLVERAFDAVNVSHRTNLSIAVAENSTNQSDFIRHEMTKFPSGRYWTAGDPDLNSTTGNYNDHTTYLRMGPTVGRNFLKTYEWLTQEVYYQCAGFAKKLQVDYFGTDTFVQDDNINYTPRCGDHLRVVNSYKGKKFEHSVFITSVSGNRITYADCNSDGNNVIKWNNTVTYDRDSGKFYYMDGQIRYDFEWVERPIMQGDVNADGVLNSADVTALNKIINNTAPTSGYDTVMRKTAADINGDGTVNSSDRTLLNQLINNTNNAKSSYGYIIF